MAVFFKNKWNTISFLRNNCYLQVFPLEDNFNYVFNNNCHRILFHPIKWHHFHWDISLLVVICFSLNKKKNLLVSCFCVCTCNCSTPWRCSSCLSGTSTACWTSWASCDGSSSALWSWVWSTFASPNRTYRVPSGWVHFRPSRHYSIIFTERLDKLHFQSGLWSLH